MKVWHSFNDVTRKASKMAKTKQSCQEVNYLEKMDKIIAEKKAKQGLVGIKFCILPSNPKDEDDHQDMAQAFCMAEEMMSKGIFAATTSSSL